MLQKDKTEVKSKKYHIINEAPISTSSIIPNDEFENASNANISSSVFNLSNTVIGAGILGFPSAIANTGYIPSIILFIFVALITSFTLHLNLICAKSLRPKASYKLSCQSTIPKLKILVDFTIAFTTFGALCAYLIVIGDSIPPVFEQFFYHYNNDEIYKIFNNRRTWIGIYLIIFILPFIYLRKINTLRYTSLFAIICFLYVVIIVVLYSFFFFFACWTLSVL